MTDQGKSTYPTKTRLSKLVENTSLLLGSSLLIIIAFTTYIFLTSVTENSLYGSRFQEQEIIKKDLLDKNQSLKIQILDASTSEQIAGSWKVRNMINNNQTQFIETDLSKISKK